jgi:pimeloyl-ACP methyl ester carboxylesterase
MRSVIGLVAAGMLALAGAARAAPSDLEVTIDGGKAPLHGALLVPDGVRQRAAVLMIPGSGPTDRNANSAVAAVQPNTFGLLAQGLAARGIETLRFDKRGVGASAAASPAEADLRFTTYVDDAVSWAKVLAAQPGVGCVVILGHSEGALIGAMVAERIPVCGLVSISGAGRPADQVILEQISVQVPPEILAQAKAVMAELKAGHAVPDAPLPALFRPSVQPYMMSWLPIDPAAEIARVSAPVLILQGTTDLQVSVSDAHRLAAAQPRATLILLDGVNHVLKTAPLERTANLAAYKDPKIPLAPGVVDDVADFVVKAGANPR